MKNKQLIIGVVLFLLGFVGVLSLLTMPFNVEAIPEEAREDLLEQFSPDQLQLLNLINPTLILLVCTFIGVKFSPKVNLEVPTLEKALEGGSWKNSLIGQVKSGFWGGVIGGVLIVLMYALFRPLLPVNYLEIEEVSQPSVIARFLYGGITEEIMMRYGVMTLVIWIISKFTKNLSQGVYWVGILIAAVLFGAGHLPMLSQLVSEPTPVLVNFIIFANAAGGVVFGWLYWKKGLEAAIIAHMFAHVVLLIFNHISA
ncbi:CPBP family intramembrane glutamic endopeptidase [Cytophagaceae bacterium ABcell3]|nr:CPBP family intramembrane glutamic endopeptidase [Cytophagaceae bacterium ABcell3]